MFCYNTSFHRSIKNSPHFLTYGIEPRLPSFPTPDLRRTFYGESEAAEMHQRLLLARKLAMENNLIATEKTKEYFDRANKAKAHSFVNNQLVLLEEYNFLGRNTKLCPKWSGPHTIINLKGSHCVELVLQNNRKVIVNVERIKPYFFDEPDSQGLSTNITHNSQSSTSVAPPSTIRYETDQLIPVDDLSTPSSPVSPVAQTSRQLNVPAPLPLADVSSSSSSTDVPLPSTAAPPAPARPNLFQNKGGIVTRSQAARRQIQLAHNENQVSSIEQKLEQFKKGLKKWYDLENVYLKKTKIRLFHCPSQDHTQKCQQKWAKIMDMIQVYKDQNSSQFHSVFSEPAEQEEEEVALDDSDEESDNPDPGYGSSSPVPLPEPLDDQEVQEEDVPPPDQDRQAERLPVVPEPKKNTHRKVHAHPTVSGADALHPGYPHPTASLDSTTDFHSVESSLEYLEKTLEHLENETSIALRDSKSEEEAQYIIDKHRHKVSQIERLYNDVQTVEAAATTSTP
jgi:hypothetical protein